MVRATSSRLQGRTGRYIHSLQKCNTLDVLTLPKKMYLWQSNLSDIYM